MIAAGEWRFLLDLGFNPDKDPELRVAMEMSWKFAEQYDFIFPGLRFLYTKKYVIDFLLAGHWDAHDIREGNAAESNQQIFKNLAALRELVDQDIDRLEAMVQGARTALIAPITQVAPVMVPDTRPIPVVPDPNDPLYTGDPIRSFQKQL